MQKATQTFQWGKEYKRLALFIYNTHLTPTATFLLPDPILPSCSPSDPSLFSHSSNLQPPFALKLCVLTPIPCPSSQPAGHFMISYSLRILLDSMYLLRQFHFSPPFCLTLSPSFILLIFTPNRSHLPLVFQPVPVPCLLCFLLQVPGWTAFPSQFQSPSSTVQSSPVFFILTPVLASLPPSFWMRLLYGYNFSWKLK